MVKHTLFNKLLRTIWNTRGQFLSLVVVISLGIMTYVCMSTTYYNLENNMNRFYRECDFADYYFQVASVPEQVVNQIKTIPGVTEATGRVVKDIPVIKQDQQRATVRVIGYPLPLSKTINRLHMYSGRVFSEQPLNSTMEAVTDAQFSAANQLVPGSTLTVVTNSKEIPLTVIGTATSPEFSYPVKDVTTVLNDPTMFGVVMLSQNQAQKLLNLNGQVNSIVIKVAPDSNQYRIKESIKSLLKPYGYQGDYAKKDQSSNAFLRDQLRQLKAETRVIPTIFLIAAIAIQFVMLGRMIKTHRLQIGIMKALGYSSSQIIWHYTGYAILIGMIGTLIGVLLGLALSGYLTNVYLSFYNLPHYANKAYNGAIITAVLLGVGAGLISGWLASRRIVFISPSESMRPEPPTQGRNVVFEQWKLFWKRVSSSWKMALRGIGRHPTRFWVTVMGVSFATSLLVVSMFFHDSIKAIEHKAYYTEQNFDLMAKFSSPQDKKNTDLIAKISGVVTAEPVIEIPVRISCNQKSSDVILQGLPADCRMKVIENEQGQKLNIPPQGMAVGLKTAEKLGLKVGDSVQVETKLGIGSNQFSTVRVVGISRQAAGKNAFASMKTTNELLRENNLISGVMTRIAAGRYHYVEAKLSEMPGIADIVSRNQEIENFNRNMDILQITMQLLTLFAILLGCAISYNSSLISFSERNRELATLRVIGMTNSEITSILGNETVLQCLLGLCLGLPLGRLLAEGVARMVSSEVYEFQATVFAKTYLSSVMLTVAFVLAGFIIAVRGIKQLNLLETLKNRD